MAYWKSTECMHSAPRAQQKRSLSTQLSVSRTRGFTRVRTFVSGRSVPKHGSCWRNVSVFRRHSTPTGQVRDDRPNVWFHSARITASPAVSCVDRAHSPSLRPLPRALRYKGVVPLSCLVSHQLHPPRRLRLVPTSASSLPVGNSLPSPVSTPPPVPSTRHTTSVARGRAADHPPRPVERSGVVLEEGG